MGKSKIKIPPADPVSYLMVVTMSGCFFSMRGARASSFNSSRAEMHCGIDRVRIQTETRRLRLTSSATGVSRCREVFTAMSRSTNLCSILSHFNLVFLQVKKL